MDTCQYLDEFKGQAGGDRCVGVGLKKKWVCWYVNNEFELDAHNGDVKITWAPGAQDMRIGTHRAA